MITKRTVIDRLVVEVNGIIHARLRRELVEDGRVLCYEYHGVPIQPGDDLDTTMVAVNSHLEQAGCVAVAADEISNIRRIVEAAHTPECIAVFKAAVAAADQGQ